MTEKPTCFLRLQGLACDWSKHNKHSRNIFSVHGFLRLSVQLFKETSFSKTTMVMRFPAKKNAVAQKQCTISRQERWHSPPPAGLSWDFPPPPPESVRTDGRMDGRTLTSQPKFFGSIGYQICLAMELRWRSLPAGSAIN